LDVFPKICVQGAENLTANASKTVDGDIDFFHGAFLFLVKAFYA